MSDSFIEVNPVEELLKAIAIVHGPNYAERLRYVVDTIHREEQRKLNSAPWSVQRLQSILDSEVKYKDWKFVVQERSTLIGWEAYGGKYDNDFRVRAEWMGVDTDSGKPALQQSRWWALSQHMVKTEIIQTVFLCAMKAEEHEIRETFKYKNRVVFNTHINVDTLWGMAGEVDVRVDKRPEAPANQRRE